MAEVKPSSDNLVAWWTLTSDTKDAHTNGYDFTETGISFAPGWASFGGTGTDYGYSNEQSFNTTDGFTLGCVMKLNAVGDRQRIGGIWNASGTYLYGLTPSTDGAVTAYWSANKTDILTETTTTNAWDSDTWGLVYMSVSAGGLVATGFDNTARATTNASSNAIINENDSDEFLWLGRWAGSANYCKSEIKDMFFYNIPLTTDNIDWLYNSGNYRTYTDYAGTTDIPTVDNAVYFAIGI